MLVIDDALLLLTLAGLPPDRVAEAYEAGEIFTTGSWYYRFSNALLNRRLNGALTSTFSALSALGDAEQHLVRNNLRRLPNQHRPPELPRPLVT